MWSVEEAIAALVREVQPGPVVAVPLAEAWGLWTAESIACSEDSPRFDKSLMDGAAVRVADLASLPVTLSLLEVITAGCVPTREVGPGQATVIMTGAPLPVGADAVVRVEDLRIDRETRQVTVLRAKAESGMNVLRRGTSARAGDELLGAGCRLRAIEIGALAEFGQAAVRVRRRSRVAILPTGDELVPIDQTPGPGRIRNSNEPMLAAQVREAGGEPVPLGIAVDEPAVLAERIARGLECDFLVLSGGVSAGQLDLVPSTLAAAGVRKVFHHVDLKPGKPIWFGVCPADIRRAHATYVFGLPGNPVSSLVCFELFVRLAIRRWLGSPETELPLQTGRLATAHVVKGDRRTYHPSRLTPTGAGIEVTPLAWHGSADLRGIVGMNGLAVFEAGQYRREAGEAVPVLWWSA